MSDNVDPEELGLNRKTVIEKAGKNHFIIVISRKSRIIMSDGEKIQGKASMIREHRPGAKVSLKTTAPLCSRTVKFLKEQGIEIL